MASKKTPEPDMRFVGTHLPMEEYDRLVALADKADRTLAAQLRRLVREGLEQEREAA